MKVPEDKNGEISSIKIYYFPNLNENESAVMAHGHHSYNEGISQMQCFFSQTDTFKDKNSYPFFEVPSLGFLKWVMVYMTIPISWPLCLSYYESVPKDKNCIKKHPKFVNGELKCSVPQTISMKKGKELAKK
jgi:hypothetical protein